MSELAVLEGFISVRAALKAGSRPIQAIYLRHDRRDRGIAWLERTAAAAGIPVQRVAADEIDARAGGSTHGGVIALAGPRRFVALGELGADSPAPFVAMIDGVEDPFNFGQAVRALYAAGCDGLVLRPRNWLSVGTAVRASAGATEFMPTAEAESPEAAAEALGGEFDVVLVRKLGAPGNPEFAIGAIDELSLIHI